MRVLKVTSPNFNAIRESWKHKSLKHVTSTIASVLKVPIKLTYMQFFTFYLIVQSDHVRINQSQGIYIHGLSQFGPCLGEMHLGL